MLSPAERRELVERPFPVVRVIPSDKTWAGCSTQEMEQWFQAIFRGRGPSEFDSDDVEPATDWTEDEDAA